MAHNQAPRRIIGSWEILEVVGSGSFAIVWKARHITTGTLAAVKEILSDRLNKKLYESLESEIAVLQRLKHANIVGLLDLYKEPGKIFLVLEYCAGGDLAQHLRQRGPLSEASCRYLLRHLAEGLKVLRQHNVIHRDLKPQNLLLSDSGPAPALKIADFGFARSLQPAGLAETLCGSPLYMAPEVLQLHRYDAKADLWSVGTILFELLTGKPPFNGANHLQLIQNIERGNATLPDHLARTLSPSCRQLLHQLLRRNPVERISFDELFSHPFLTGAVGQPEPHTATSTSLGEIVCAGISTHVAPAGRAAAFCAITSHATATANVGYANAGDPLSAEPRQSHQHLQPTSPHPSLAVAAGAVPVPQRRYTPTSAGSVRLLLPPSAAARNGAGSPHMIPLSVGSPMHPAIVIPPSPPSPSPSPATACSSNQSLTQQQDQHQQTGVTGSGGRGGRGGQMGGQDCFTAFQAASVQVQELARQPSPGAIAAAVAVATAIQDNSDKKTAAAAAGGDIDGAAGALATASRSRDYSGSDGSAAVAASGGGCSGSGALGDSVDSDYVVVASPATSPRPPPPSLCPRIPHPAMAYGSSASGSDRSSRNASAAGAPPPPATTGAATSGATPTHQVHSPLSTAAAAAAAVAAPHPWQHLLTPIAAATLPLSRGKDANGATRLQPHQRPLGAAAAASGFPPTPTSITIRVPAPGCVEGDAADPLLLTRVVGLLLDDARSRCTAMLDQEVEVRQLGETHTAAAAVAGALGGDSFVSGGGGRLGVIGAPGDGGWSTVAEEAAGAMGALVVASRLLVAALNASTAAAAAVSGTMAVDYTASLAARLGEDKSPPRSVEDKVEEAAFPPATEPMLHPPPAPSSAAAAPALGSLCCPSLSSLAALALTARSLLAVLDEHLHSTLGRLLLSKVDSAPTCLQAPLASSPAVPGAQPPVPTVVPCGLDTMMATAVHHSRAAAGEELMGNAAGAVDQYGKAADVLLFLLAAPQQQHHHWQQQQKEQSGGVVQDALLDAVRPPLAPADRQRLTRYYAAVRLRQSAAMAALGPTAAAAAAAVTSSSLQPPSAQHYHHLLAQMVHLHPHLHPYTAAHPLPGYPHCPPPLSEQTLTHGAHGAQEPLLALQQRFPGPGQQYDGSGTAPANHESSAVAAPPQSVAASPYSYGRKGVYGAMVF